ncbi:MAG: glycosyltransferase family 4 protein [Candidatus Latescibacterota bacterium]|nr:glycosyltransferase family 4 protein [Candidatus Latescibacterota bacterium]
MITETTRILFLARRYPPSIGGIETHCYELHKRLKLRASVRLVALRKNSLLHLLWFLPYCLWTTFWAVFLRRVDVVYFADGVAGFIAPLVRPFGPARFCITIYGLEMTYKNPCARFLMQNGAKTCNEVVVISENTKNITANSGIPETKLSIIHLGVEPQAYDVSQVDNIQQKFENEHSIEFKKDRILFMFGRQVRRKGMAEFIEKGMPLLDPDIKLIIGGIGVEAKRIFTTRETNNLTDRILIIGSIPDDQLAMLQHCCDLFLMPNIQIPNDVEGFGQTQLECMYAGMPVIAFAVDALTESVQEGGYLIEPNNYSAFAEQIHAHYKLTQRERETIQETCRNYVRSNYCWNTATDQYIELFQKKT